MSLCSKPRLKRKLCLAGMVTVLLGPGLVAAQPPRPRGNVTSQVPRQAAVARNQSQQATIGESALRRLPADIAPGTTRNPTVYGSSNSFAESLGLAPSGTATPTESLTPDVSVDNQSPLSGDGFFEASPFEHPPCPPNECWTLQILPDGLLFRSYLAGVKEPRFASYWNYDQNLGRLWDISLGGRVGVLRYGTSNSFWPEGWQLDIEGAGQPRLDPESDNDLVAADFRFGIPLTYRRGIFESKFGYYHLSSHLGDEFMLSNPGFVRINYSRDVVVLAAALWPLPMLRVYSEAGWAFASDVAEPWEFQFGAELTAPGPTGLRGAPFAAVNGHLRQEVEFGGNLVAQTGWMWRGADSGHLMRFGVEYYNGKSRQFEFFNQSEQQIGIGLWYDY